MIENAAAFIEHVKDHAPDKISKEWVIWMLKTINRADVDMVTLNPKWIKASHNVIGSKSCAVTHADCKGTPDEPDWT